MLQSDKELLELAAKADGIEIYQSTNEGIKRRGILGLWNPLTNDGDALRLAVKRKIFRCHMDLFHDYYEREIANGKSDDEATRRAIVQSVIRKG